MKNQSAPSPISNTYISFVIKDERAIFDFTYIEDNYKFTSLSKIIFFLFYYSSKIIL